MPPPEWRCAGEVEWPQAGHGHQLEQRSALDLEDYLASEDKTEEQIDAELSEAAPRA